MKCPHCGADLGQGLLPARCPACGQGLGAKAPRTNLHAARESADRAAASRASVEGLSGRGRGRRDRSQTTKRVARILLAFVLVAVFCVTVAFVAYRAEIIGGRTVPNVVGWSAQSAQSRLEECGFSVGVNEVSSSEQDPGKVVSEVPTASARIDPGSTVSIDVAVASQ